MQLLSWRQSGFSAQSSVVVEPEDPAAVERLIRYVMRAPVALERLHYDRAARVMEIRSRPDGTVSFAIRKLWRRPHRAYGGRHE